MNRFIVNMKSGKKYIVNTEVDLCGFVDKIEYMMDHGFFEIERTNHFGDTCKAYIDPGQVESVREEIEVE